MIIHTYTMIIHKYTVKPLGVLLIQWHAFQKWFRYYNYFISCFLGQFVPSFNFFYNTFILYNNLTVSLYSSHSVCVSAIE